jgi:Flp pilus assembly protein TadD
VALGVGALLVGASLRPLPVLHAGSLALRRATAVQNDPETVLRLTEPLLETSERDQVLAPRARALIQLNRFGEARAAADELVRKHPDFARGYALRGIARTVLGDTAGAEADFDKAVELDPADWSRQQREWFRQQPRR